MGATGDINYFDGSIICDTSLVAQGSENGSVTDWDTADEFVLCVAIYFGSACNKATDNEQIKIEYRKDGGSWTAVSSGNDIQPGGKHRFADS